MILVEHEPVLPVSVETVKAQVLLCLEANHPVHTFQTAAELRHLLDEVLDGLVAAGYPRGLSRIVLFCRDPLAIKAVAERMIPGGAFTHYPAPSCWMQLGRQLPQLRRMAERIEPGWTTQRRG